MSADLLLRPAATEPVWQRARDDLATLVAGSLATFGGPRSVEVRALGAADEHAPDARRGDEAPADSAALIVHLTGHEAVVGPLAGDEGHACPRCLARRWQALRPRELRDALELGGPSRAAGEPAVATTFVADHLAAVVAAHTTTAGPASVYRVDLDRLLVLHHSLLPDPECPDCAAPPGGDRPMRLRPTPKRHPDDFRVTDLLDLDLPLDGLTNPVCGAVGAGVVTDLTSVSTAATVGSFTTRSGSYLRQTMWGGHADSYAASVRIGVLEGLERYAGVRVRSGIRTTYASYDDLGDSALDPRACGLYPPAFYDEHPEVDPFDPARPIGWVEGWSLRDDRPLWVPQVLAHYQTPDQRKRFVQSTSSGCATGGCLEEAVYHGLMEEVERDAFLVAWYAGLSLPEIDVCESTRPQTRSMVERLAMYGYDARFLDTRVGFRIPVVTGVAVRRDGGLGTLAVGAGAGLDPEAAVAGALCEIATDAVNLRQRTLKDEARLRAMSLDFDLVAELHDHPLAFGVPEMAVHAGRLLTARTEPLPLATTYGVDLPPLSTDLRDDLAWCLAEVTSQGFDVVVVDQTLPEQRRLGLATVNVTVPGLVPIDFGWDRQRALHHPRVRTAPHTAGLLDHDLTDADLHRVPHPFP